MASAWFLQTPRHFFAEITIVFTGPLRLCYPGGIRPVPPVKTSCFSADFLPCRAGHPPDFTSSGTTKKRTLRSSESGPVARITLKGVDLEVPSAEKSSRPLSREAPPAPHKCARRLASRMLHLCSIGLVCGKKFCCFEAAPGLAGEGASSDCAAGAGVVPSEIAQGSSLRAGWTAIPNK